MAGITKSFLKGATSLIFTSKQLVSTVLGEPVSYNSQLFLLSRKLNRSQNVVNVRSGLGVHFQVRYFYHGDMDVPDFTKCRRNPTKNPERLSRTNAIDRRAATSLIVATGLVATLYCAKTVTIQYVLVMAPSLDVLALSQIEVKLSDISKGLNTTVKWRGKPVFIRHRTEDQINKERATPLSILRHPERDEDRVKKPEWLVLIGICTHLGCVPIADAGDWGAYYCPCHGSHYDYSGRIRKGPAPTNMEIPDYEFLDDNTILIG